MTQNVYGEFESRPKTALQNSIIFMPQALSREKLRTKQ
jgi:hypothetical protein